MSKIKYFITINNNYLLYFSMLLSLLNFSMITKIYLSSLGIEDSSINITSSIDPVLDPVINSEKENIFTSPEIETKEINTPNTNEVLTETNFRDKIKSLP